MASELFVISRIFPLKLGWVGEVLDMRVTAASVDQFVHKGHPLCTIKDDNKGLSSFIPCSKVVVGALLQQT